MLDEDGILRPDNPHEHIVINRLKPSNKEITEGYNFVNKNVIFRAWARLLRRIGICFLGPWIKFRYKLKIHGKENIKAVRKKGVIVTINHVHNFDNLLVGTRILNHRKCYFITLKDNINMPFIGFLLKTLGGIPIPTKLRALASFEKSIDELMQKRKAVLICPEASLWPYYRGIRPFKKGAFRFAVNSSVPVLPVVITFRRKSKKEPDSYRYYFTSHVGKPIVQNLAIKSKTERINDLKNRTYEYYKKTIEEFYKKEKQD